MIFKVVIKKSLDAISKVLPFVIIYYLLNLALTLHQIYKLHILTSILLICLNLVIQCGIMGIIAKVIEGEKGNFKLFTNCIKFFFLRYIGAFIILGILIFMCFIPYIIFLYTVKNNMAIDVAVKTTPSLVIRSLSMLLLTILSIYVFPFVFVKGEGADAVLDGVKYLFKNFKRSKVLIIMGIAKVAMLTFILGFALKYPYTSWQYISLILINRSLLVYIELAIFAGACYVLREG